MYVSESVDIIFSNTSLPSLWYLLLNSMCTRNVQQNGKNATQRQHNTTQHNLAPRSIAIYLKISTEVKRPNPFIPKPSFALQEINIQACPSLITLLKGEQAFEDLDGKIIWNRQEWWGSTRCPPLVTQNINLKNFWHPPGHSNSKRETTKRDSLLDTEHCKDITNQIAVQVYAQRMHASKSPWTTEPDWEGTQ